MEGAVVPGSNSVEQRRELKAAEDCCGVTVQPPVALALGESASGLKQLKRRCITMRGI